MRTHAREIFLSALKAVDPKEAVKRFLRVEGGSLIVGRREKPATYLDLSSFDRIIVVGAGKATAPMAKAVEDLLGDRISSGLINVKYGFTEPLSRIETVEAGHPIPDGEGVEGTRRILEILRKARERDLVISVISGGGSALLPQPADGISLSDKQAVTKALIACGATIAEINAVRKHISLSKGGQMARAAYPATVVNLMLSDVVGDRMDVIASGPFTPDESTFQEALQVIEKYALKDIPAGVRRRLEKGGVKDETPKRGDPVFERVHNVIVGSNILALEAAEEKAEDMGYNTIILSSMIEGETRDAALFHTAIAKEILITGRPLGPPACVISGGETTVTIKGGGLGGRNQEFCLASAIALEGIDAPVVVLSAGTDGNDGPTDAAGAIVDTKTTERGRMSGLDAVKHLAENDSYHYLEATGDLLVTGPTNTNVMDVRIILAGAGP